MKLLLTIFIVCCTYWVAAQQPPSQLPSLLDNNALPLPILHSGESPEAFIRRHVFVQVAADKPSVYAGEPFLVTYKLFTAFDIQPRVKQQPVFEGCSVVELSVDNEPVEAMVNGQKYHVYTIRKLQVTALDTGNLQLAPLYVDNIVQLLHDDGRGIENYAITLHNDPLNITVHPLPATGRPETYSGVVGQFSIRATVDSNNIPTGESATLTLVIEGTGNIEAVRQPLIAWPAGTEHFEASDTQRLDQASYPAKGFRQFTIPFIGTAEGSTVIAPVSLSYFDPVKQQYTTVSTDSIPLQFTPALTREQQMQGVISSGFSNSKYIWIIGAIAATVLGVWLIGSRRHSKAPTPAPLNISAAALAQQQPPSTSLKQGDILLQLEQLEHLHMADQFFAEAKKTLLHMISQKTGINSDSADTISQALLADEATRPMAHACATILQLCNRNLYAPPADSTERQKVLEELNALFTAWYAGV